MVRTRSRAKKRERPLGSAVVLGLVTTLAAAILIVVVQLLDPQSIMSKFFMLVRHNSSATLPLDPLYQEWAGQIQEEDAWYGTTFSLLCGGLVLGRLAPRYATTRRVLITGALMSLGVIAGTLGFLWPTAVFEQNTLNAHEGGRQVYLTAPARLVLVQTGLAVFWTAFCVLGTWLGLLLRDRKPHRVQIKS